MAFRKLSIGRRQLMVNYMMRARRFCLIILSRPARLLTFIICSLLISEVKQIVSMISFAHVLCDLCYVPEQFLLVTKPRLPSPGSVTPFTQQCLFSGLSCFDISSTASLASTFNCRCQGDRHFLRSSSFLAIGKASLASQHVGTI